ncbi:hypothetical protein [Prevotella sp. Rep29]|uniref:hypothetical protein n=1 Tax=Prevotella sp. Rep29 TaxID=2691580 RepID=UPI001C6F00AF|nr:hypothetical protein [Prevotella sp. Rep29]QYR10305.1 hypothetical protein GRF55_03915 [Prevotella sp. Rep29]
MSKVIEIKSINQHQKNDVLEVVYEIGVNDSSFLLEYQISGSWEGEIAAYCDSPIVSFLYDALLNGYDFKSEYPISEKLYYNLTKHFIPHMCAMNHLQPIHIDAPLSNKKFTGKWVGTGISCGVDSMATLKEYTTEDVADDYKLTHLLYFKIGAHHGGHAQPVPEELENRIFRDELQVVKSFCKKYSYPLIIVDSNINTLSNQMWGTHDFFEVFEYRNSAVMLMMQNHFSKYYHATGYATFMGFVMDIHKGLEHNEWWSLPLFSSDNLAVIPANMAMTRIEKTKYISDFEPSYNHLMVCWNGKKNCGVCPKCIRTQVALDWLGGLQKYNKVFDLEKYYQGKSYYLRQIVDQRKTDQFYCELYEYASENGIKLPPPSNFFRDTFYKLKSLCYRMTLGQLRR